MNNDIEYGDFKDRHADDFDFPCSSLWREYYNEQYGHPSEERQRVIYLDYESPPPPSQPWDQRQQWQLDQTKAELMNIKHKLAEMTTRKPKPTQQPQKSTYKGLVVKDGT